MPRPRHPLPYQIRSMRFDPIKGKYFVSENGLTFYMDLEQTRLLKEYFRGNYSGSIIEWHSTLSSEVREKVTIKYNKT